MTIDEAISLLKQYIDYDNPDVPDFYTMEEACKVVIKALEQDPNYNSIKTELKSCEDAISRQAVLEVIRKCHCEEWVKAEIGAPIEALSPVTAQQKMGHWVKVIEENGHAFYLCSLCKEGTDDNYDFCPFCGCKMQEVQNE